jgi:hypothetical protein
MAISDHELAERARTFTQNNDDASLDKFDLRGPQYDAGLARVDVPAGKCGLWFSRGRPTCAGAVLRERGVCASPVRRDPLASSCLPS